MSPYWYWPNNFDIIFLSLHLVLSLSVIHLIKARYVLRLQGLMWHRSDVHSFEVRDPTKCHKINLRTCQMMNRIGEKKQNLVFQIVPWCSLSSLSYWNQKPKGQGTSASRDTISVWHLFHFYVLFDQADIFKCYNKMHQVLFLVTVWFVSAQPTPPCWRP